MGPSEPARRSLATGLPVGDASTEAPGDSAVLPVVSDACTWMGHRHLRLDTALTGPLPLAALGTPCRRPQVIRNRDASCPSLSTLPCHRPLCTPQSVPHPVPLGRGEGPLLWPPGESSHRALWPEAPATSFPPGTQVTHSMVLPQSHHSVFPMLSMSTWKGAKQSFCKTAS